MHLFRYLSLTQIFVRLWYQFLIPMEKCVCVISDQRYDMWRVKASINFGICLDAINLIHAKIGIMLCWNLPVHATVKTLTSVARNSWNGKLCFSAEFYLIEFMIVKCLGKVTHVHTFKGDTKHITLLKLYNLGFFVRCLWPAQT